MLPFSQSSSTLSTDIRSTGSVSLQRSKSLVDPLQQGDSFIGSSTASPLSISPGVGVTITDFIGNTLQTAYNIGDLNGSRFNYADSVNNNDINDVYRFHLDAATTVNVGLTNLSADADLYLLDSTGHTIAVSNQSGNNNELLDRFLSAGVYYVQVKSFSGSSTSYSLSVNGGGTARDPGNDRSSARDLGNLSRKVWNINDFVGTSDPSDYYHFDLSENGNFHLSLSGLSSDVDVALYNRIGSLITASTYTGTSSESIDRFLDAGTYYIRVYAQSSGSNYALSARTDTPSYSGTRTLTGTLGADTFDVIGNYTRTVISGDGNVDFGAGRRDVLDLSGLRSTSVSINYANTTGGGVLYDPGTGTRLFDSILLNDGRQILFEGIDQIRFSDRTINLSIIPNDPLFNQQWNLGMMGVQDAWRFTTGSSQVMAGIEDTGLALNTQGNLPPDLQSFYFTANNYADDFSETDSHGTSIQSIIASASNNGSGMSGINWNSTLFVTDVLGDNPGDYTWAQATNVMAQFAASRGQRLVINMSLGVPLSFDQTGLYPDFEAAVAANPNVLFVIAAGNNGNLGIAGLAYPADLARTYSNVIAVGASWGRTDYFGNSEAPGTRIEYPFWWGSQYGNGLTLMAPSEVIAETATRSLSGQVSYDYTTNFNGTSAAAPNVTGVASLVWSANPNLTAAQVKQILSQTATDLGSSGYDSYYGNGFVNADAAARRAIALAEGAA
ncbi:MAG: S8 family serine peptidase [Leptolyngbya sp. BL-A-14]